jgi:NAD dependent epimerase/dehydratase family enzyme
MLPAKYGFVIRTGNGHQYMPWIHIADLCGIYLTAIKDQDMNGAFNAVSPEHVNHNDFVRTMARVMNRPVFLPPLPSFILRIMLGEMSDVVLKGSRVSSEKIISAGYKFLFPSLREALADILFKK